MKKVILTIAGSVCFGIAALHAQQVDSTGNQQNQSDQYKREPRYQNQNRTNDSLSQDSTVHYNSGQLGNDSTSNPTTGQTGQGYQYDTTATQPRRDSTHSPLKPRQEK